MKNLKYKNNLNLDSDFFVLNAKNETDETSIPAGDFIKETSTSTAHKGEKGYKGLKGSKGIKGNEGDYGDYGESGQKGQKGIQGSRGIIGQSGRTGIRGEFGLPGQNGQTGETGDAGRNGRKGQMGPRGFQGITGMPGQRGRKGNIGAFGERGDVGSSATNTSEKGQKGESGQDALIGPRGPRGDIGDDGSKGDKGRLGEPGERAKPLNSNISHAVYGAKAFRNWNDLNISEGNYIHLSYFKNESNVPYKFYKLELEAPISSNIVSVDSKLILNVTVLGSVTKFKPIICGTPPVIWIKETDDLNTMTAVRDANRVPVTVSLEFHENKTHFGVYIPTAHIDYINDSRVNLKIKKMFGTNDI